VFLKASRQHLRGNRLISHPAPLELSKVMTSAQRLGFFAALGAYTIWGLLPLYFKALEHVRPEDVLAHRVIWSVPTGLLLIIIARNWRDVREALTLKRFAWLTVSGVLIGANWWIYIWAVGQDRVMEASLGYYINPLLNVLLGLVIFKETLRPFQWLAVAVAAIGVTIMTLALGRFPWVALSLAGTFGIYSIVRKQLQVDSRAGFIIEVAVLFFPAMVWFATREVPLFQGGGWDVPLLLAAGPITAIPLILFALAAKRLALSTIGMMQYIGPTLQFIVALALGEAFGVSHAIGFVFIWTALIVFTADSVRGDAKARRLARAAEIA